MRAPLGPLALCALCASLALAQDEPAPPAKTGLLLPREVIGIYLKRAKADANLESTALEALDVYWAIVWTKAQERLDARRALRAAALVAPLDEAYTNGKLPSAPLLGARAWQARIAREISGRVAENSSGYLSLLLGKEVGVIDGFPLGPLPADLAPQGSALEACRLAARAALDYWDALLGAVTGGKLPQTPAALAALVDAGRALGTEEEAHLAAQLMARRAHDRWLAGKGQLLAHYDVEAPEGPR